MTIGEISQEIGLSADTLRYYLMYQEIIVANVIMMRILLIG